MKESEKDSSQRKTSETDKWAEMDEREGNKWASKTCKSNGRTADKGHKGESSYGRSRRSSFEGDVTSEKTRHTGRD